MNGQRVPDVLTDSSQWIVENFVNYDSGTFMVAFIQILHRTTAYALFIIALAFIWFVFKHAIKGAFRTGSILLIIMLMVQIILGILTLLYSKGVIPVGLGVLHQGGALLLLTVSLYLAFLSTRKKSIT